MKIGIIGGSLAGLVAGDKLAKAGHDVMIIEKNRSLGGRLATQTFEGGFFDDGFPYLSADGDAFKSFIDDFIEKQILFPWADDIPHHDGAHPHKLNRDRREVEYYASANGLNSIANYLKRWVDIKFKEQAGGLTYIGPDRGKKRSWMVNLTDISVYECDAVIIATPATQAYGLLQTAQDETAVLRLIRVIDEVHYKPRFVLMASCDIETPSWKGITCSNSDLSWLGNETSKSEKQQRTNIAIHSSARFAHKHVESNKSHVKRLLLERAAEVADESQIQDADPTFLHHWKYYQATKTIDKDYMELEMEDAPLALIGDYFKGNTADAAYNSAIKLANHWIEKYSVPEMNTIH